MPKSFLTRSVSEGELPKVHPVTQSRRHLVTLSPGHPVTRSPGHPVRGQNGQILGISNIAVSPTPIANGRPVRT